MPLEWQHLLPASFCQRACQKEQQQQQKKVEKRQQKKAGKRQQKKKQKKKKEQQKKIQEEEAEEDKGEDLETSTNEYKEQNGAYLLYSSIFIHAHLSKGCGANGLPAGVHDLNNQAVPPSLAPKHCATAVCAYLHGMRFTDWQSGFT